MNWSSCGAIIVLLLAIEVFSMPLSGGTKDSWSSPEKYRGIETIRIFPHEDHLASASLWTAWSSGKVALRLMITAGNGETGPRGDRDIRDQEGLLRRWHNCEFRAELIGLGNFATADVRIPTTLVADSSNHSQKLSGSANHTMSQSDYAVFDKAGEWHLAWTCPGSAD
jgi:hypothetical protein